MEKYEPGNKNIAQRFFNRDRLFEYDDSAFDNNNKQPAENKEELEAFINVFASYYILNERRLKNYSTRLDSLECVIKEMSESVIEKLILSIMVGTYISKIFVATLHPLKHHSIVYV